MNRYKFRRKLNINSIDRLAHIINIDENAIIKVFRGCKNGYVSIKIKNKNGSLRTLSVPRGYLKNVQGAIYKNLLAKIPLFKCVHGGVEKHSIITNASCHIGREWIINLDIKNFFDAVHYHRVREVFDNLGCSKQVSEILTGLVTHNYCLPQGAPTSPYLSNLVLINIDRSFVILCKNIGAFYTRYFDDITISGNKLVVSEKMKKVYSDIIKREGYKINYKKIHFYHKTEKQIVNNLIVNKRPLMPDDNFIKNLNDYVGKLKKFGLGTLDNKCIFKEKESLLGKINFLGIFDSATANKLKKEISLIDWGF